MAQFGKTAQQTASKFEYTLKAYDLFAPVYNGHKFDKEVLPKPRKLCLHFQAPNGPNFYYGHPSSKYAFETMEETMLPIITSVQKVLIDIKIKNTYKIE